jgi:hypothetical protein
MASRKNDGEGEDQRFSKWLDDYIADNKRFLEAVGRL